MTPEPDSSDLVYRILRTLTDNYLPGAEKAAELERLTAELEPFAVGEGFRERHLRELCAQLHRTIDSYRRAGAGVSERWPPATRSTAASRTRRA
ncbi:hypothetical protein [Amycolatopsis sp. NPDC059021]|uniref:hypothetical protein n=1 Tax=Amycolatopsis sp. NPDC059021 TaxID=3346704 RepID=UPI00366B4CD6